MKIIWPCSFKLYNVWYNLERKYQFFMSKSKYDFFVCHFCRSFERLKHAYYFCPL